MSAVLEGLDCAGFSCKHWWHQPRLCCAVALHTGVAPLHCRLAQAVLAREEPEETFLKSGWRPIPLFAATRQILQFTSIKFAQFDAAVPKDLEQLRIIYPVSAPSPAVL